MPRFYLRTFAIFFGLRVVSVLLHYTGPSPWGGPLILSPDRFIPEALTIEAGIFGLWMLTFGLGETLLQKVSALTRFTRPYRGLYLFFGAALSIFSLVDFEVVRWLGQHMTASYITNFAGARDGQLFTRILSGDKLFSFLAALQMVAAVAAAVFCFILYGRNDDRLPRAGSLAAFVLVPVALLSPYWQRPSEKRWRRVCPASISILAEVVDQVLGADSPKNPERAQQDLIDLVLAGKYDAQARPKDPKYPLLRDTGVGMLPPERFQALPAEEKPDIILIVFETMRGMNTGFLGGTQEATPAMPLLHDEISKNALYFPRMHAAGYPSVAGAMGIHMGVWPHHSRIVFSSYLHIKSLAFPQMLAAAGYNSYALLGADPSFSNFTPWFRRWYDQMEYDPKNHHDGPLVDRFLEIYDKKQAEKAPLLLTLWTATTHPPYDVPKDAGEVPGGTNEERYLQAMRYADAQLFRLVTSLKKSSRWERTIVFLLGDHSQPVPWQWTHTDEIGELNPGHTWTSLAIFGGEKFAPSARRDDRAVSHVDLGPTILAAINLKHKHHFFGQNLLSGASERPVLAFRYGTVSREVSGLREIFRVDGAANEGLAYTFDASDVASYGALEGGTRTLLKPKSDLERHRDVARAWSTLLADDRLTD